MINSNNQYLLGKEVKTEPFGVEDSLESRIIFFTI